MTFSDVPTQGEAIEFFRRALAAGRLAHAYILVGPEGVGKHKLARALAQYVFCENHKVAPHGREKEKLLSVPPHPDPLPPVGGRGDVEGDRLHSSSDGGRGEQQVGRSDDACGECRRCRLVASGQFADLHWYRRLEGRQQLTVEVLERFAHEMGLKPVESDRKVFVLEDVDKLTERSSNKLLKVLEEPPEGSLLMLLALDVRDFLPTVLSRCHVIRLRPQAVDELACTLERECGCSAADAKYLSHFTMGSPGLAAELADGSFLDDREWLVELVTSMRNGDHFRAAEEIFDLASSRADKATEKREVLVRLLDVMALFYRDVLAASCGSDESMLVNTDRLDAIRDLGERLGPDRASEIIESVNRAREAVGMNANQKLLLDNLTFDVARIQSL